VSTDGADGATDAPSDQAPPLDVPPRRRWSLWQECLVLGAAAVVLAVVIKTLFVQAFYIPSGSMEPGLVENDRILVQKVSYWFGGTPQRGDVVVFDDPGGWLPADDAQPGGLRGALAAVGLYPSGGHLVKRVIGVAGDTIVCCDQQGRIEVNGHALDEGAYIADLPEGYDCNAPMIPCGWSAGPVPEGELFVMGDNRADSADSTVHLCRPNETECAKDPYVEVDSVVGKVFSVVWPLGHARFVGRPAAFDGVPDPAGS
jgi:signal peptidase I